MLKVLPLLTNNKMNRRIALKRMVNIAKDIYSGNNPSFRFYDNPRDFFKSLTNEELLARMIFGEARSCSLDEGIWIGYTPINRMDDKKKYNGEGSLKDVLLCKGKYHSLDPEKTSVENFRKVLQPAIYEPNSWKKSLDIANQIMRGKLKNYNYGQTSFITKNKLSELVRGKLPINPNKISFIATPRNFKHQFYFEV